MKWSRLTATFFVLISNTRDHEPNAIDHLNTEHVRYSSPQCIMFHWCPYVEKKIATFTERLKPQKQDSV